MGVFNDQIDVMMNKLEQKWNKGPFNIFNDITLCALDIICGKYKGQFNIFYDITLCTVDVICGIF